MSGQKLITKTGTVQFSAPEIFTQAEHDEKVDVWSAGIVLFMMLTGVQPFYHQHMPRLMEMIAKEEPNYHHEALQQVSKDAIDLLKKLLTKDPRKRPSAKECLGHPWFADQANSNKPIKKLDLSMLAPEEPILNYAAANLSRRKQMKQEGNLCHS